LFAIAAPKTNLCPALLAGHTRHGSRPSVGGRSLSRNPCRRPGQVCARCHRKKKDVQAILCSGGKLVSVYGLMLFSAACRRRVRLIRTCPVGTTRERARTEGYERPALPRQPERPSNAFTWQFDPSQDRRNPGSRFAINNLASQRPECHDADNPSWDVPNNRQPCSDTDSDTRAALQKTGLANNGRRIGPGGRGEGAYATQMGQISVPECHGSQHDYDKPAGTARSHNASLTPVERTPVERALRTCGISDARL
jgi:hypothetical protein